MARKQVIVQLDDELVAELDGLAAEVGVSRSELLRRGAARMLQEAQTLRWERQSIEAYRRIPDEPELPPYEEG